MKLVIDMSALSVDKRKMVVDYLQDNEVPITWGAHASPVDGCVCPGCVRQRDIYADVAKQINSLPMVPLGVSTSERVIRMDPAMCVSYSAAKADRIEAELAERFRSNPQRMMVIDDPWLEHGTSEQPPKPFLQLTRQVHKPKTDTPPPELGLPYIGYDVMGRQEVRYSQEWADAEARREQGLEPKRPMRWAAAAIFTPNEVRKALIARLVLNCSETLEKLQGYTNSALVSLGKHYRLSPGAWLELTDEPKPAKRTATTRICPFCGNMPEYTHRNGVPVCKCTTKGCAGNDRWLGYEEFEELNVTLNTPALRLTWHQFHKPNMVNPCCQVSRKKHHWEQTEFTHLSEARPILRCVHCNIRIYGPYNELPPELKNED